MLVWGITCPTVIAMVSRREYLVTGGFIAMFTNQF